VLIILAGTVIVFIFADLLFEIIYQGKAMESLDQSILVFRIMIIFPLVSFLDQVYGKLVLIVLGRSDVFFRIFSICSVINLVSCAILSYVYGYIGTAVSSIVTQIVIAGLMGYYATTIQNSRLEKTPYNAH
jgi:PST family polysaccharide transporter